MTDAWDNDNDDEEQTERWTVVNGFSLTVSPETMRQPTNLELAELITLQSNLQTALIFLKFVDQDIMSDEDDYRNSAASVNYAAEQVTKFWLALLLDGLPPHA